MTSDMISASCPGGVSYERKLGMFYTPHETTFRLWAPSALNVELRLYSAGSAMEGDTLIKRYPMKRGDSGLFQAKLDGNLNGVYYDYAITNQSGVVVESADPWALACGVNGKRSMVVDLRSTDPVGWEKDHRIVPSGLPAICEIHVGDFSAAPNSGVRPEWRGKYLGFTDPDTTLNGEGKFPTCVNYLRSLGITHVQLQPIADFCTVDESTCATYNWGYDIDNYNVPEGSYSTDPFHGDVRIRECKQMIQALHNAGLGVVMDVVYNHTYRKDSWLARTAPGAYYRHDQEGGYMNASGCGNETASEREPFRNYMIQSILYWAQEYHIDGFRFDLMAIHDVETMKLIRQALDSLPGGEHILTYGEPWAALPVDLHWPSVPSDKNALMLLAPRIGVFCDATRDTVAGNAFQADNSGYASGKLQPWMERSIKSAVCGWCRNDLDHYIGSPFQTVQYISSHDNYTLWDRLVIQNGGRSFSIQHPALLARQRLIAGIYMTCAGLAFFPAGEEFCRTKSGHDNTYNGPAELNWLDWQRASKSRHMVEWYRGLLQLRQNMYGDLTPETVQHIRFMDLPNGCVGFSVPGNEASQWQQFVVCYNPTSKICPLDLPAGEWQQLCNGTTIAQSGSVTVGQQIVAPVSIAIYGMLKS